MAPHQESVETVVIGAGHAGLIASWHLREAGREHLVLERRATLGGGWQDRWDAFCLVSPNEVLGLPGYPFDGDPGGFLTRREIIDRTAGFADAIGAPVRTATDVSGVRPIDGPGPARFEILTSHGTILARSIIVATGAFHVPKVPTAASSLPARIVQLHAHDYRRPDQLPPGGVLIVGSGQTGVQLAEELFEAGREVVLSVGHCGRVPRRYRGQDFFHWFRAMTTEMEAMGIPVRTVDRLPDPRLRFACNPHLSGHGGGHDTDLRAFAQRGIRLAGRFLGADVEQVRFGGDLAADLTFADGFFDERFREPIDRYIELTGRDAPPDDRTVSTFQPIGLTSLDLAAEGITSVLWTSGYTPDYGWIEGIQLDDAGLPKHARGVSTLPGLTFIGMLWQHNQGSANLAAVAADAEYLAPMWRA
jgi:putative flavoprotein involved in K+ transport